MKKKPEFKSNNIVVIVQARLGSTRLPGKVLMKIKKKALLEHVVERVKQAKKVNKIIVATSNTTPDDLLVEFLKKKRILYFRGSENDLLQRYYLAAKKWKADLIVRVCGDQPLVDPHAIDLAISNSAGHDFTYCKHEKGWPDGTGSEVISFKALEKAHQICKDSFEREHIQPFFLRHQDSFKVKCVDAPEDIYCPGLQLAVDTLDDFERINQIYQKFYRPKKIISLKEVIAHQKNLPLFNLIIISNFTHFLKEATNITIFELAQELKRRGCNIFLVSGAGKEKKNYEAEGIKIYLSGFKGKKSLFNPRFLIHQLYTPRKIIKELGIEKGRVIIHNFSSSPLLSLRALLAKKDFKNAKVIQTIKSFSLKRINSHFFSPLNKCDALTVSTSVMKDALLQEGVKEEKITLIKTNINLEKFKPLDKKALRQKYNYFPQEKIIFYYGALRKEKGIHNLVQALPPVIQKYPSLRLIIGSRAKVKDREDGKDPEQIKAYILEEIGASKLGLEKQIQPLLGDIDIVDYLNLADLVVFAYPTLDGTESNPSCLLEAMACKVPIVTTDLPQIREILSPEEAILVKPNDRKELVRGINGLLENEKLGQEISERAFQKVKQFDVKVIASKFMELYQQVQARKGEQKFSK